MDVRRSVSTRFWSDSWIEELNSDEKLLWLYLLTNQNTNMLGIYELPTMKRISFETGLTIQSLSKAFEGFERIRKAFILQGKFVFMPNWVKNQSFNPNMLKSAKKAFTDLSTDLKTDLYNLGVESFESLSNGLVTLPKIEIEIEIESEIESESESESETKQSAKPPLSESLDLYPFDVFWDSYQKKIDKDKCFKKWSKLSQDEKNKAMVSVGDYVRSTPDQIYRKNPLTWLNGKCWNDEILFNNLNKQSNEQGISPARQSILRQVEQAEREFRANNG